MWQVKLPSSTIHAIVMTGVRTIQEIVDNLMIQGMQIPRWIFPQRLNRQPPRQSYSSKSSSAIAGRSLSRSLYQLWNLVSLAGNSALFSFSKLCPYLLLIEEHEKHKSFLRCSNKHDWQKADPFIWFNVLMCTKIQHFEGILQTISSHVTNHIFLWMSYSSGRNPIC